MPLSASGCDDFRERRCQTYHHLRPPEREAFTPERKGCSALCTGLRASVLRDCGPLCALPEPSRSTSSIASRSSTCCPMQWGAGTATLTAFSRKQKCRALPGLPGARCFCNLSGAVLGCVSCRLPLRERMRSGELGLSAQPRDCPSRRLSRIAIIFKSSFYTVTIFLGI